MVPPDPIPNSAVKRCIADGSADFYLRDYFFVPIKKSLKYNQMWTFPKHKSMIVWSGAKIIKGNFVISMHQDKSARRRFTKTTCLNSVLKETIMNFLFSPIRLLGSRLTKVAVLSFAMLLSGPVMAGVYVSGLSLSVDGSDNVTVNGSGSSQYVNASVGAGGDFAFIEGWGVSSGTISWSDTNNTPTLSINSAGVHVLNAGGIANANGSKSGSVTFTGSTTLGATLRAALGTGTNMAFTRLVSGATTFEVSGTVTIEETPPQFIRTGMVLTVPFSNSVTINSQGSNVFPGGVGPNVGSFPYINGWGHSSGTVTWDDTNNADVLRLDDSGVDVLIANGVANANGGITGSAVLTGDSTLGAALRAAHGEGAAIPFFSTVSTSGSNDFGVSGTVTILGPEADVGITKSDGVTSAVPGGSVGYTIVASNSGPDADTSVSVNDTFPADLTCTYVSVTAGGASGSTSSSGNLADTLSMPAGSSVLYGVTCNIASNATGTLSNTATVSGSETDNNAANDSATDDDTVLTPEVNLSIAKDDGLTEAIPGSTTVVYTIVASNPGPSDDPSVAVTDVFPADLTCTYISVAAGGATGSTSSAGNLADTLSMPAGSMVTYQTSCDIDPGATGTLSNTAAIVSSVTERNHVNNSATDDDTVLKPMADLAVTKEDSADPVEAGHDMFYTITVDNPGPSDATNVVVSDTLPDALLFQSTSGCAEDSSGVPTCSLGTIPAGGSAQYTIFVKMKDAANNPILNTASAVSDTFDPQSENNSDTQETTVFSVPIPVNNPLALMFLVLLLSGFGWTVIRRR
jgi:uncharacterized repeat protein (TIGR01451 family)